MNPILLLLLFVVISSAGGVAVKIALESYPPVFFTLLRFAIATATIIPFLRKSPIFKPYQSSKLYIVSSLAVANVLLFAFGIQQSTIITSSIIYTAIPIVVGIISHVFLYRRYKRTELAGIGLGLAGALIVILLPVAQGSGAVGGTLFGNILLTLAMVSFALYGVLSQPLQKQYSKRDITGGFFILAAVTHATLVIINLLQKHPVLAGEPTVRATSAMIYSGVFGTTVAYLLHQKLIQKGGAELASFTFFLNPIASAILAVFLLGEHITPTLVLGASLTFIGVWLFNKK